MTAWIDSVRISHSLPPSGLPERYRGLSTQHIKNTGIRACAEYYLKNFWGLGNQGKAPGFFGRSGTFKTFAAACIVERIQLIAKIPCEYVQTNREFGGLERRRFDPATEHRLVQLSELPFLVLDDITDVKPSSEAMAMLDAVVKIRDANGFPTLYTGNAIFSADKQDALLQQFGAAMTRRILEGTTGLLAVVK